MSQQLESELREALSLKASGIPSQMGRQLHGIDYHPRTGRTLPRVTAASLAGVAATTGVVASVVILGSSQPAFAGWSPSPTPASAAETSAAQSACQAQLNASPAPPGAAAAGGLRPLATDVRGPFTLVIYQSGATSVSCLYGPSITMVSRNAESAGHASGSTSVSGGWRGHRTSGGGIGVSVSMGNKGSGSIAHMTVAHLDSASQGPYTLVEGQVATGVTAVTLLRTDGGHVQASTGNGWFVAWWPGDLNTTSAEVTTAGGTSTQALGTASPPPPAGNGTCHAGSPASPASVCTGGSGGAGSVGQSTATRGGRGSGTATDAG